MEATNSIILGEDTGGKGRVFQSRFLQAGLVKYSFGVCLLTKETINKFVNSFIGCPVRIDHKDITDENAKDERVGVVSDIWFNDGDGWFWCKGVIFDDKAIDLIKNGYNVSCQYEITEYSDNIENKLHNGIPYDKEILNGKFEHLAIVDNPRYEGALIAVNALMASNDKWITIKPNGEENTGKHLLLKKGESPYDAIRRVYGDRNQKQLFDTSAYKKHKEDYKREREEEERRGQEAQENNEKQERLNKLIKQADSISMFESGSIEKRSHEKALKALKDFDLTPEEKEKAIEKLNNIHEQTLELLAKSPSSYAVGPAEFNKRVGGDKSKKNYEKAMQIRGERDKLIKDLKERKRKEKYKEENQNLVEALKKAHENGDLIIEVNGKTWFRNNKGSKSWTTLDKYSQSKFDKLKERLNKKATNEYKPILDYIENYDERNETMNEETKNVFERLISALKAKNEADDKDKKAENEDVDKRDIIRQIMAIAGKEEASEDVKTIAKLAEKLAYDKSEAGTADNKAKNEEEKEKDKEADNCRAKNDKVDKRELIDQVGGILKGKVDDEIIRTVIGKLEEIAYDKSEAGTADNKAKNDDDEYKKLKDDVEKDVENCKAKNSMDALKELFYTGDVKQEKSYLSQKERIELGKQLF